MSHSILDHLRRLKALQEVDREIRKLRKEEERWPAVLALRDKEIAQREEERQAREEARKAVRRDIDRLELELKRLEDDVVRHNVTLNTVKTNKEYTAILNEIAQKKAEISAVEESILTRLDDLEAAAAAVKEAKTLVDAAREEHGRLEAQAKAEREEIRQEREELEGRRGGHLEGLDPDLLDQYERIAGGRDGVAVVPVVDGVCQGCFINLTAQEINLLMGQDKIVRCKNCSRILFLEP